MNGPDQRYWVLIETGANQAYIFDTNRLRHVVGASYLVHQLGTAWVPEAARRHGADVVYAISGKALLLTGDPEIGRNVISEVSDRTLEQAPGLEVTGVVGPGFDPVLAWFPAMNGEREERAGSDSLNHVEALESTYEVLEAARRARPPALLRDPMLPWFEPCRESGLPVAGAEDHPEQALAAASVLAKAAARFAARGRMRDLFADQPDVVPAERDDLADAAWLAVIHADGNGIGQLFTSFPDRALTAGSRQDPAAGLTLEEHVRQLAEFTHGLARATETALALAVRDATQDRDADGSVLPVVFGGDDVTVVCDARFALDIARRFVLMFQEQTAVSGAVSALAARPLTAAAGIAYVKPHHPFSAAYALAEELTASAKSIRSTGDREVSAIDFHVAFESTLADLAALRERLSAGGLARYGGPYAVTAADEHDAGQRDIAVLDQTQRTVAALSSSTAHDLREGLARGPEEFASRLHLATLSPGLPEKVTPEDISRLAPVLPGDPGPGDGEALPVARLLDAMLLQAVTGDEPGDQKRTESSSAGSSPSAGMRS